MRTILLALLFCACSPARPDSDDEASIQGGHADKRDAAVGVVWMQGGGFCSGTLIAPNVVLTAGHCVAESVDAFYTGPGAAASGSEPASHLRRHAVAEQVAHPSYSPYGGCPNRTFDVGLVRLAEPIRSIEPLPIAKSPPRLDASCRMVGYGANDANGVQTFEQRRAASGWIKEVSDTYLSVLWRTGIADHGDSGGPLLCGDRIAGVTSCHTDGNAPDHKVESYARVDDVGGWIASVEKEWAGSP